jgi:hypothetical protein
MEKHFDKLTWFSIYIYQKMSDQFIQKYIDKLDLNEICKYQKLSEEFMEKYIDHLNWEHISYRYKLVNPIFAKYIKKENNWLHMKEDEKINKIKNFYKIIETDGKKYIECYKSVKEDCSSIFNNLSYTYDKLNYKYETLCDYNEMDGCSNGFGCWTIKNVENYAFQEHLENFKVLKCLVPLDSICMTPNGKIRSSVLIVVDVAKHVSFQDRFIL